MYRIEQEEPEGWEKAFVVYFSNKRILHCRYLDSAQFFIRETIRMCYTSDAPIA